MTAVVLAGAFLGLLIGSFVNVVAYRVPAGISVVKPPSACPGCGHEIRPRDNLPVLGWLLLHGRCRDCGAAISIRYPLVEAITAGVFAAAAAAVGAVGSLGAYWWFAGLTIALVLTDLDLKRIPNRILYPGTIVAVTLLGVGSILDGNLVGFWRSLLGGAAYFGFLLAIAVLARGGFGFGDVKLAFVLGVFSAYRSWGSLLVAVFAAFVIGGVVSVVLLAARRVGRKESIPFGPSLVAGSFLAITFGESIAAWYVG